MERLDWGIQNAPVSRIYLRFIGLQIGGTYEVYKPKIIEETVRAMRKFILTWEGFSTLWSQLRGCLQSLQELH